MNWGFKEKSRSRINETNSEIKMVYECWLWPGIIRQRRTDRNPGQMMSPVSGPQAVQSVVVFLVQRSLCHPVDQIAGKKLHEDVVEPGDRGHVQWETIVGHPADHPGPLTSAEKRLSSNIRVRRKGLKFHFGMNSPFKNNNWCMHE